MQLGDRMKEYEFQYTCQKLMPFAPAIARIDGRCFHSFCRNLDKPWDKGLWQLMQETTKYLIHQSSALLGYTQSDEISLLFWQKTYESQLFFDGKVFKINTSLASLATGFFNRNLNKYLPNKLTAAIPNFDCRVFSVPSKTEAVNYFIWRQRDAIKNSISAVAQQYYSPSELDGKNSNQRQEMLFQKGINWNDYSNYLKRGAFFTMLPINNNTAEKTFAITETSWPEISRLKNAEEVLFEQVAPVLKSDEDFCS